MRVRRIRPVGMLNGARARRAGAGRRRGREAIRTREEGARTPRTACTVNGFKGKKIEPSRFAGRSAPQRRFHAANACVLPGALCPSGAPGGGLAFGTARGDADEKRMPRPTAYTQLPTSCSVLYAPAAVPCPQGKFLKPRLHAVPRWTPPGSRTHLRCLRPWRGPLCDPPRSAARAANPVVSSRTQLVQD